MGVVPTVVAPEQALLMEQEVKSLVAKEAIECVPIPDTEAGIYSRYLILPKEDRGLCPILDLRLLNKSVLQLKFKMLTLRQIIPHMRSQDWFITIDLKHRCDRQRTKKQEDIQCTCHDHPHRQHIAGPLYKSPEGLHSCPLCKPNPPVVPGEDTVILANIPGAQNTGADTLWRRGPRPGEWRIALLQGALERVHQDTVWLTLIATRWPGRVCFSDRVPLLDGSSLQIPIRRDLLSKAGGSIFHPRPEQWKLRAWPLRWPSS